MSVFLLNINRMYAIVLCVYAQKLPKILWGEKLMEKNKDKENWHDIYTAYMVMRHGTLSKAAEDLGVYHSTVLRRINALEKRLNTRLFHRHPRGYTPTDAGYLLLSAAENAQSEFERLMGKLQGVDGQLTGRLVITTVEELVPRVLPVIRAFQTEHPNIQIELLADRRVLKLEHGEAHISFRPGKGPNEPDYIAQKLAKLQSSLYASRAYIDQFGANLSLEDIRQHRFIKILGHSHIASVKWLEEKVPESQIYLSVSSFHSLRQAVLSGFGVGLMDSWIAGQHESVVQLIEPPSEWDYYLWIVTHKDAHHAIKVHTFVQFAKKFFAKDDVNN